LIGPSTLAAGSQRSMLACRTRPRPAALCARGARARHCHRARKAGCLLAAAQTCLLRSNAEMLCTRLQTARRGRRSCWKGVQRRVCSA